MNRISAAQLRAAAKELQPAQMKRMLRRREQPARNYVRPVLEALAEPASERLVRGAQRRELLEPLESAPEVQALPPP